MAAVLNWLEIDAAAIRSNIGAFRAISAPTTALGAVVKSNAYGHGLLEVSQIAVDAGVDWLCVNSLGEAIPLRKAGHNLPILIMGYVALDQLQSVVEHQLQPVVYNEETIERLEHLAAKAGVNVKVHLKVETGTHRQGVMESRVPQFVTLLKRCPHVELEGLSTHFANIEDTTNHAFAELQIQAFDRITESFRAAGCAPRIRHSACSAALLLFQRTQLDLARVGIAMYGLWPSKETRLSCLERGKEEIQLTPALSWKSRIAQVKEVPEGALAGYGCTWKASRASRLAILPLGYFEGYDRALSGVAHVLIRGRRAPVRGRVCMNITIVDVTDIPGAAVEDEVVLLGLQGDERITAEQLAEWAGTIPYEIVARIHPDLERRVV
jgi:alanine racemase